MASGAAQRGEVWCGEAGCGVVQRSKGLLKHRRLSGGHRGMVQFGRAWRGGFWSLCSAVGFGMVRLGTVWLGSA